MAPNVPPLINIEPEHCPEAVIEWFRISGLEDRKESARRKDLALKAKKHLCSLGWDFWYINKKGRWELRYKSPSNGKNYISLRTACESCIQEGGCGPENSYLIKGVNIGTPEAEGSPVDNGSPMVDEHPSTSNSAIFTSAQPKKQPREKRRVQMQSISSSEQPETENQPRKCRVQPKRGKKRERKSSSEDEWNPVGDSESEDSPKRGMVLPISKRVRQGDEAQSSDLSRRNPRTIVSWLIDNRVVLPNSKVFCCGTNNVVKNGRLSRSGIACDCCGSVFTLTRFEAHASCTRHRPSTSIFLEDGRSLLQCQREALSSLDHSMQREIFQDRNDSICSICWNGGELVLCDRCPSSLHLSCLGLDHVPDGDWFCPPCCCRICNRPRCRQDSEDDVDNSILACCQCERKFHLGCLKSEGCTDMEDLPKNNWFCNKACENIFLSLQKLIGKPIRVAADTLNWTLLKTVRSDDNSGRDLTPDELERSSQIESKLSVALGVMQECFDPVIDVFSGRDIVRDVIFSRGSEFNRPNCRGFYTVILEMNDEVISVATVRIHGQKVAELPFVTTSEQYRRLGMCRILMNELEKQLTQLRVECMVLPSSLNVVDTWTNSFGFARMTDSDKSQFLEYTFLEFQDTIRCHKPLLMNHSMNYMA